ncbi:Protein TESPA1 [Eumeta japonica]|uniref:Protein TESPA1 n=1 Tax=Eumeta variegata TaxID=151549 RepID=A0A4C1U1F2_EUMVA|nr:Protein TESPA1 [Eumeta japonica]
MEPRRDTISEFVSSLVERRVRGWLGGVIDDMRRNSPVQQWLDSIPVSSQKTDEQPETEIENKTTESNEVGNVENLQVENNLEIPNSKEMWKRKSLDSGILSGPRHNNSVKKKLQRDHSIQSEGYSPRQKNPLLRDYSLQSDGSGSSGSSMLNVLGARKVDAESVLLALGFGPSEKQQKLQRIPDRFLIPSKMKGISTEQFIKDEQRSMRMHDCGIFGYRGLTGNPHVPPSTIVAKIMECIIQNDLCREEAFLHARHSIADMRGPSVRQPTMPRPSLPDT